MITFIALTISSHYTSTYHTCLQTQHLINLPETALTKHSLDLVERIHIFVHGPSSYQDTRVDLQAARERNTFLKVALSILVQIVGLLGQLALPLDDGLLIRMFFRAIIKDTTVLLPNLKIGRREVPILF